LVVNDVYVRRHLREFMTLLLQRLGFRRCFLVQDSVASTYGAGIGYGCVVDIGAQKTSIACIEDGISQLDARVRLPYGGGDLDQVLLLLLRKCGFPYRECNVQESYVDAHLLDELKEKFCHLNASVCGAQEKHFNLRKQNGQWLRYTIQVGDEAIMAPLALFHTELLNITGRTRAVCTQLAAQEQYDCEDCFDAEYLKETGCFPGFPVFSFSRIRSEFRTANDAVSKIAHRRMPWLQCSPSSRRSRASSTSSGRLPAPPPMGLPQPQAHPLEAPKIIIIHPGSQHLRIGRAADLNPLTLLHAVAYRRRQRTATGDHPHHDPLLPPLDNVNTALMVEFEEQRLAVSRILQHCCVVDEKKRLRVATPPQQLAHFNRSSQAEKVPPPSGQPTEEPWLDRQAPVLFDDRILRLSALDARDYDIHFPMQRGELNVHKAKGGSLQVRPCRETHVTALQPSPSLTIPLLAGQPSAFGAHLVLRPGGPSEDPVA